MRDTRLEPQGAEFLVLAHLLIEGWEAHKAYTNNPGYDVIALNPAQKRQCRIQVKSRYLTSDRAFGIKTFDCDFVGFAKLNRAASIFDEPSTLIVANKTLGVCITGTGTSWR